MSVSRVGGPSGAQDLPEVEAQSAATLAAGAAEGQSLASERLYGAKYVPGQKSPVSGQYIAVDGRGKQVGGEKTIVKGEPFPPTERAGLSYRLVDPSRGVSTTGEETVMLAFMCSVP